MTSCIFQNTFTCPSLAFSQPGVSLYFSQLYTGRSTVSGGGKKKFQRSCRLEVPSFLCSKEFPSSNMENSKQIFGKKGKSLLHEGCHILEQKPGSSIRSPSSRDTQIQLDTALSNVIKLGLLQVHGLNYMTFIRSLQN